MKLLGTKALLLLLLSPALAFGQEATDEAPAAEQAAANTEAEPQGDGIESPRAMSGMSILGNEEAPKALVIIPWKSSEIGDDLDLTESLDDRAKPVDRDVFLRELRFYEIRSGGEE